MSRSLYMVGMTKDDRAGETESPPAPSDDAGRTGAESADSLLALQLVASVVSRAPELSRALNAVLDRLLALATADIGAIHLLDDASGELCLAASRGLSETFRVHECRIPIGTCLCGLSVTMDEPLVVDDLATDPRFSRTACREECVGSWVGVPLRSRDRTLGILTLYARECGAFQTIDRRLLTTIGDQLGVAVENARWYAAMRESAVAEERAAIAAELHDGIAQSLAYLNVQTARVQELLERGETAGVRQELAAVREVIRDTYQDVRQLLVDFRNAPKEGGEFASSLRAHLDTFGLRTAIKTDLVGDGVLRDLSLLQQAEVFRMIQEALANVRKHAKASRVRVVCDRTPTIVEVRVEDDGCGCESARFNDPTGTHLGLALLRERATRLRGTVQLTSTPGGGTTIVIGVPRGGDDEGSAP